MTSWDVMKLIAGRPGSRFAQRKHWMVIPNVSWGFLRYEADMLVITKSRFCTEIEVKVSMADWKQDQEKRKFTFSPDPRIKYQYYAAPRELALRHEELELPQGWGVIAVRDPMTPFLSPYSKAPVVDVLKEAEARDARKVTDKELMILARLACFRVWRRE